MSEYKTREERRVNRLVEHYRSLPLPDFSDPVQYKELCRKFNAKVIPEMKKIDRRRAHALEESMARHASIR